MSNFGLIWSQPQWPLPTFNLYKLWYAFRQSFFCATFKQFVIMEVLFNKILPKSIELWRLQTDIFWLLFAAFLLCIEVFCTVFMCLIPSKTWNVADYWNFIMARIALTGNFKISVDLFYISTTCVRLATDHLSLFFFFYCVWNLLIGQQQKLCPQTHLLHVDSKRQFVNMNSFLRC